MCHVYFGISVSCAMCVANKFVCVISVFGMYMCVIYVHMYSVCLDKCLFVITM